MSYARHWSYRPDIFPFSAWAMFAVQKRFVSGDYGVRAVPLADCSAASADASLHDSRDPRPEDLDLMPLDARRRQLAAAAYRLEHRQGPDSEHFRALLEDGLLAEGVCYEVIALELDSWSKPPGKPHLRGRVGPFLSQP